MAFVVAAACAVVTLPTLAHAQAAEDSVENQPSIRSYPPDDTSYARPAEAGERSQRRVHPKVFLADTVVSNTDPTLTNTDVFNDGELSIAINPANHDEIAITSFGGGWGATAPVFHSLDGGVTWTKQFTIPVPPGVPAAGCPCDQTIDWGRSNQLAGTFLSSGNIYSGTTFDPTNAAAFSWLVSAGVTQRTNQVALNIADQPWLLVNRDPQSPGQDNVYVAYDDFSGAPDMRVAVSNGAYPPVFATDVRVGFSTGAVNPGLRMAKHENTGAVYSLWQRVIAAGAGGSKRINYRLNRSTDGGQTWPLGGRRRNRRGHRRQHAADAQIRRRQRAARWRTSRRDASNDGRCVLRLRQS